MEFDSVFHSVKKGLNLFLVWDSPLIISKQGKIPVVPTVGEKSETAVWGT